MLRELEDMKWKKLYNPTPEKEYLQNESLGFFPFFLHCLIAAFNPMD